MFVPNLSSVGCFGAQLESVTPDVRTYACTHRRTPGEYSANSGPARLVPGPELSNESKDMQKKIVLLGINFNHNFTVYQLLTVVKLSK